MIKKSMPTSSSVHIDVPIEDKRMVLKATCKKICSRINELKLNKLNTNHDADGQFSSIAEESSRQKNELEQRISQENKNVDRSYYLNNYRGKTF